MKKTNKLLGSNSNDSKSNRPNKSSTRNQSNLSSKDDINDNEYGYHEDDNDSSVQQIEGSRRQKQSNNYSGRTAESNNSTMTTTSSITYSADTKAISAISGVAMAAAVAADYLGYQTTISHTESKIKNLHADTKNNDKVKVKNSCNRLIS